MSEQYACFISDLESALEREKGRIGSVSPQFSYYERLVALARIDVGYLLYLHAHVMARGFSGL